MKNTMDREDCKEAMMRLANQNAVLIEALKGIVFDIIYQSPVINEETNTLHIWLDSYRFEAAREALLKTKQESA